MKSFVRSFGLVVVLHSSVVFAQTAPHAHASTPSKEAKEPGVHGYRAPCDTYRPFKAEEPLKDWRAANREVREAGGHAGLMKDSQGRQGAGP
jgi:hypothetical protein